MAQHSWKLVVVQLHERSGRLAGVDRVEHQDRLSPLDQRQEREPEGAPVHRPDQRRQPPPAGQPFQGDEAEAVVSHQRIA